MGWLTKKNAQTRNRTSIFRVVVFAYQDERNCALCQPIIRLILVRMRLSYMLPCTIQAVIGIRPFSNDYVPLQDASRPLFFN